MITESDGLGWGGRWRWEDVMKHSLSYKGRERGGQKYFRHRLKNWNVQSSFVYKYSNHIFFFFILLALKGFKIVWFVISWSNNWLKDIYDRQHQKPITLSPPPLLNQENKNNNKRDWYKPHHLDWFVCTSTLNQVTSSLSIKTQKKGVSSSVDKRN